MLQPMMECLELSRMKELPEWKQLDAAVSAHCKKIRRIISAHTSTCCQPRKQKAVIQSLKEAGLEDVHNTLDGVTIQIELEKVFVIDSFEGMQPFRCSATHA